MTLNEIFEEIEHNQKKYFYLFAGILFGIALVSTLLFNLVNFTMLWIIFPILYFFLILFINRRRYGLFLIGIAFGGYYIGLAIAGNFILEWHVIFTLLFLGIAALIITQFAIQKIVVESLGEMEHRELVFAYAGLFIIASCVIGGIFSANPAILSPAIGVVVTTSIIILNTAVLGYLSKRFWASFFLNLGLMVFFAIPMAGLTKLFAVWQFIWTIPTQYVSLMQLFLVIGCIFGGLFGLLGKYKQYTKPPITLTTPIDAGYVYRDRLSIMMLLGKNNFVEYECRGDKVVFYNRMDVKMGFRPKHEIRLDIIDDDDVDVYLEKFAEREKLGKFRNPNKLREQHQPIWNLLGYALKAQLAKLLRPILLIISGAVVTYFIISLVFTITGLPAAVITLPIIIAVISAGVTIGLLVLFYIYISKQMTKVLEEHPEFSMAFIGLFVGVFLAAWFISYLIQGALIVVSTGNIAAFSGMLSSNLIYVLIATAIVGISSIQVLGVQNFNTYFYHKDINVFKHPADEPTWLDDKAYWVFRYAYEFPGEFTVSSSQIFHEDIERMDVWVNAKTGIAEWLVGDYHWREIWTRIPKSKDLLIGVNFSVNFHTPVYYVLHKEDYEKYCEIKTVRQLLSYFWGGFKKAGKEFFSLLAFWTTKVYRPVEDDLVIIRDPPKKKISDWTVDFFTDVPAPFRRACADYLANIPWNFLRYPYGVDNVVYEKLLYREGDVTPPRWPEKVPPEPGANKQAMENKRICPKCGYVQQVDRWDCEVCKTDVRKYSAYTLNAPHRLKRVKGWFGSLFRRTIEEEAEQKRLKKIQEREKIEKAKANVEAEKKKRKKLDKFSDMFLGEEDRKKMKEQARAREEEEKAKFEEIKAKAKEECE